MSNQFKALSDKTKATDAIIKDSELDAYVETKQAEGREVKLIDSDGTVRPYEKRSAA